MLIASALRSGLSFQQGLDSSAADGKGEVSRQMRRALREAQMGSLLEPALGRVADRMHSEDLRWTVLALGIQREVGGNLSNILETAASTIKGRAELRREVRTLSAEGRLSGYVLAALPVGLFLYMLVANREYVSFFWTNVDRLLRTRRPGHPLHPRLHLDAQTREDRGLMNSLIPILAALIVFVVIVYVGLPSRAGARSARSSDARSPWSPATRRPIRTPRWCRVEQQDSLIRSRSSGWATV